MAPSRDYEQELDLIMNVQQLDLSIAKSPWPKKIEQTPTPSQKSYLNHQRYIKAIIMSPKMYVDRKRIV